MPLRKGEPVAEAIHELSHFGKKKRPHKQIVAIAEANHDRRRRGGGIKKRAAGGGFSPGGQPAGLVSGSGPNEQASMGMTGGNAGWSANDYTNAAIGAAGLVAPSGVGTGLSAIKGIADQAEFGGDQPNTNGMSWGDAALHGPGMGEKAVNWLAGKAHDWFGGGHENGNPANGQFMTSSSGHAEQAGKGDMGFMHDANPFSGSSTTPASSMDSSGTNTGNLTPATGPIAPASAAPAMQNGAAAGDIGQTGAAPSATMAYSPGTFDSGGGATGDVAGNPGGAGNSFWGDLASYLGMGGGSNPSTATGGTTGDGGWSSPDMSNMEVASQAGKVARGGGIKLKRAAGGGTFDPSGGIASGIVAPITQVQAQSVSPYTRQQVGNLAQVPTEKLREMALRYGRSPQAQIMLKLIQAREMGQAPEPQQQQQGPSPTSPQDPTAPQAGPANVPVTGTGKGLNPINIDPTAGHRRGGGIRQHFAMGGNPMGMSVGEADPWWVRSEAHQGESGFLHGDTAGRADKLMTTAPSGAYIIPADVVAGLGEGNSLAGKRVIDEAMSTMPHGVVNRTVRGREPPEAHAPMPSQGGSSDSGTDYAAKGGGVQGKGIAGARVPVALSHGEYQIAPEQVAAIGKGNLKLGHAILDAFVVRARKEQIDKLKKLKGPVKT